MTTQSTNFSCKRCKKVITAQIWQCPNLHFHCSSCLSQTCIECNSSLQTPTRNTSAEDQLKQCESLKCNNSHFGCEFEGRLVDFSHHLSTCEFSDCPKPCLMPGCELAFKKKPMIKHLLSTHKTNLTSPNKAIDILKNSFYVEVFRQVSQEEEWKNFDKSPVVYRRLVGDEERFYLLRVWTEDWLLKLQLYSLTHDCEPVKYQLDTSRHSEAGKSRFAIICTTSNLSKSRPGFSLPVQQALKHYSYISNRGDIKALLVHISFANSSFCSLKY